MEPRQLSASIIQAINRIRCRQVVDTEGRRPVRASSLCCPGSRRADRRCNPGGHQGRHARPQRGGLEVRPGWSKGAKGSKRDGTRGPHHPHGQPTDRRDTYLVHPTRTCAVKKPQETPRDPEHRTTKALREIGVEYVVQGAGRGAKSFLLKHARL